MLTVGIKEQNKIIIRYNNELENYFTHWVRAHGSLKGWESLERKIMLQEFEKQIELEEINVDECSKFKFLKNRSPKL